MVELTYLISGHGGRVIISQCLTCRLYLTARLMHALPLSKSSLAKTMRIVSLRFLPLWALYHHGEVVMSLYCCWRGR